MTFKKIFFQVDQKRLFWLNLFAKTFIQELFFHIQLIKVHK